MSESNLAAASNVAAATGAAAAPASGDKIEEKESMRKNFNYPLVKVKKYDNGLCSKSRNKNTAKIQLY